MGITGVSVVYSSDMHNCFEVQRGYIFHQVSQHCLPFVFISSKIGITDACGTAVVPVFLLTDGCRGVFIIIL